MNDEHEAPPSEGVQGKLEELKDLLRQRLGVRDKIHTKDIVSAENAPVQFMKGEDIRIPFRIPSGGKGDASTPKYREKIRKALRDGVKAGRILFSPYMILRILTSIGPNFVAQRGPNGMNEALAAVAAEPEFDLEKVSSVVWGHEQTVYKPKSVTLEESLEKECSEIMDRIQVLSPTSYVVLDDLEYAKRKTARERLERAEAELAKTRSTISLANRLYELVKDERAVTTGSLAPRLAETDEEVRDPDGKFRKRIAEILKHLGFAVTVADVDGKKTKVFLSPNPTRDEENAGPDVTEAPKETMPDEQEIPEKPVPEPQITLGETVSSPPEEVSSVPADRKELPGEWRTMAQEFLQDAASREFISLEELVFRAMGKIPHELNIASRGSVSKMLLSLGLASSAYEERKVFHPPGGAPSLATMREHFSRLDEEIVKSLNIGILDAPAWMSESQRMSLSYLEHSVLLLCEEGSHTRSGLFPGHKNADWQRKVMSAFQAKGLVSVHGTGFFTTYSGSRPAVEQALDRGFLLSLFWPREAAIEESRLEERLSREDAVNEKLPSPDDPGEDEAEEEKSANGEAADGESSGPPTIEELAATVGEMYTALKNHADQIRNLKRRVKELEDGAKKRGEDG